MISVVDTMFSSPTCVQSQCLLQEQGEDTVSRGYLLKKGSANRHVLLEEDVDGKSPIPGSHQTMKSILVLKGARSGRSKGNTDREDHVPEKGQQQQEERSWPMALPIVQNRSVRFMDRVRKISYGRRHHVLNPRDIWYQHEEYCHMWQGAKDLVERVTGGELGVGHRKYCIRGLEKFFQPLKIKLARAEVRQLVLQLQQSQRADTSAGGISDLELIACQYHSACAEAVEQAISRGMLDEEVIQSYMKKGSG